jgi:hypothetical protein
MRHLICATLATALATTLVGCGVTALAPTKANGSYGARNVVWSQATTIIDLTDEREFETDMPDANHPFASPLKYRIYPKKDVGRVLELAAPTSEKPSRGFLLTAVDDAEAASFAEDPSDEDSKLASRIKVNYQWANNTGTPTKETAIAAMPVFIVEYVRAKKKVKDEDGKEVIKEITGRVAIGYAWTNNLDVEQLFPVPRPNQPTSMQVRFDGEDVPLRFITKKKGPGLDDPCSEDAFNAMKMEAVPLDNFVRDVHSAFPETYKPVVPSSGPEATDKAPLAVGPAPDTNVNLKGIVAVGFGAQIPAGVCSHAILGNTISVQRSN